GALYRVGNAIGFIGQYQVSDQLRVGYAFDLTTTRLGAYNAGTHEVMIAYDFRFIKGRTISPRYF
ncbi:MAG: type IX secretion system membrane protein PorP/SprF, partial [bacterium]